MMDNTTLNKINHPVPREEKFNERLAELLRGEGLDADYEYEVGKGRAIDVRVELDGRVVALECKKGQRAPHREAAEAAAAERLDQNLADAAVAVCFPDLRRREDLRGGTTILAAPVGSEWVETTPAGLAAAIRRLRETVGDIEAAAARFQEGLKAASLKLSASQVDDIAARVNIPLGSGQPALRAALLVACAALFHARLDNVGLARPITDARNREPYRGDWPPDRLSDCLADTDPVGALHQAWQLVLAVDYKPVFDTAMAVLAAPAQNANLTAFARGCGYAALSAARALTGGQFDLLGRVFHRILDEARHTGAYYTSTAAAALLAGLTIRPEDIDRDLEYTVVDPACGTGTLLAAVANRIQDMAGGDKLTGRHLIEEVLHGYDVDIAATHMAAVTLGLIASDVAFRKMNIHRFHLGEVADPVTGEKMPRAGSLELMDGQTQIAGWPTSEQVETGEQTAYARPYDLVIMNPPFTRDSLRHDHLREESAVKKREARLFAGLPVQREHSGGMFLLLGERLCAEAGTLALVYPTASCGAPSAAPVWGRLLGKFHLETVVTSHDPQRINFSENTKINESLFVLRCLNEGNRNAPTRFVNLAYNPATAAEAVILASAIREGRDFAGQTTEWPRKLLLANNWSPVRFLSPYLTGRVADWFAAGSLGCVPIGEQAEVGPAGRRTQDAYARGDRPHVEYPRRGVWFNNQEKPQVGAPPKKTMRVAPDCWLLRKDGKGEMADRYWEQSGRLLLPLRYSTTSMRLGAVRSEERVLGSGWSPARLKDQKADPELWEKAMAAYFNSTVGMLAALYSVNPKKMVYPNIPLEGMRNIPVPDLTDDQRAALASVYDRLADEQLARIRDADRDPVRCELDEAICRHLGWDDDEVSAARRELAKEPSITGTRASS